MKKITIVLTVLLLSLVTINLSATNVSGLISTNTKWTLANSPYIVTGNILVNNGVTLTIEPGVTVKFNSGLSMQIDGALLAQGTSSNKITFTSNTTQTAGAWGYIYFSDASTDAVFLNNTYGTYVSGSILEYCVIQYAGGANVTNNGALRLDGAHPFVNYCTIEFNSASGIAAYNLTDSLKISNSLIIHNTNNDGFGGGIYEDGSGVHLISANTISHNSARNGGGIYIAYGGCANTIITNNIVSNNRANGVGGGISCGDGAHIANNIIMNNSTLNDDGGGIGITPYTYSNIFENIIINNTSGRNGGGIEDGAGSNSSFNVIADNIAIGKGGGILNNGIYHTGIEMYNHIVRNTSANDAGMYSSSGDGNIKFNTVAYNINKDFNDTLNSSIRIMDNPIVENNNIFGNSVFYEIYNENAQGTTNLATTNNWWGTTDDSEVQAKIYDWIDNNTLDIVNYSPFLITPDTLAPVSPPANVSKTNIGGGQVKITWDKNPESDIAGYHLYFGGFTGYSFTNMIDVGNNTSYNLTGVAITDTIAITAYDRTYNIANELNSTIVNDNMTNGNESWYASAVDTSTTRSIITEIPNSGFENWISFNQPNDWLFRKTTASQSSDKYAGNYALKLQTTIVSGNNDGNGVINSLPPSGNEGWQPSFPISARHATLNGYYKYTPLNGDSCQFIIVVYKHGYVNSLFPEGILGYGHICKSASSTYAPFSVTINYFDNSIIPDSAFILLSTYKDYYFDKNTEGEPLGNSTLYVDNLSFDNNISSVPEHTVQNKLFNLYPNPATDIVTVNFDNTNNADLTLNIYTVIGTLVKSEILKQDNRQINIGDLSNGIYVVTIKTKEWTGKQKLIIQR